MAGFFSNNHIIYCIPSVRSSASNAYCRLKLFDYVLLSATSQLQSNNEYIEKMPLISYYRGDVHISRLTLAFLGMQDMEVVRKIYDLLKTRKSGFCLLQCTSTYPCPPLDVNLRVMDAYREEFPLAKIGYSGHELGVAISIAAVAKGAKVNTIEIYMVFSQTNSHGGFFGLYNRIAVCRNYLAIEPKEPLKSPVNPF